METPKKDIQAFFEAYERATNALDNSTISTHYADVFMFGGPQGIQSVRKEDFLKILPNRKVFFSSVGLQKTRLVSFEQTMLDGHYVLVHVIWTMQYVKNKKQVVENETSTTYILFSQENLLQIVMQIDHQDLVQRVKELGLV